MTVAIPTQTTRELTPEEKREHVIAYSSRPHGTKGDYLIEHGLSPKQVRRWRRAR